MPGKTIHEPCCICGATKEQGAKLGRYNGKVYCQRHLDQMRNHGKIISVKPLRGFLTTCCICGKPARVSKDGKEYCQKHYMNLYHHNKILERTIYDPNEYIDHPDEGYTECITYDKDFNESARVLIDLDKKELVQKYKVYVRKHGVKTYAAVQIDGHKYFLHRFLLGIHKEEYTLQKVVDHINGNSLDNRLENLRICTQKENMCNIRKESTIVGVNWYNAGNCWSARVMQNYKSIHLGYFNTYEEAVYARIKWEKENFGNYGPNKDLFYILDLPSPIEELKKLFETECNRIG